MAEDGGAGLNAGAGLDLLRHLDDVAHPFGDDDDEMLLAGGGGGKHPLDDILLEIKGDFGHDDAGGAAGDAHVQREIPRGGP